MSHLRTESEELIRSVLKENYLNLRVDRYELAEDVLAGAPCTVTAVLHHEEHADKTESITGTGVGFIDALYHGMIAYYGREYPSLETISFTGFSVRAEMETSHQKGADAEGVVSLAATNSDGRVFTFEESGRSIVAASIAVVVEALEYFINSERAFLTVYNARQDAADRNREDLVRSFTEQMMQLVKVTSYSSVIERAKAEALG